MEAGDRITVTALGEELEYEVYDWEVIQPSEYQKLAIVPGQDTLTLLTCTPYMVNTERLLVNAVRVNAPVEEMPAAETEEATEVAETTEETPERVTAKVSNEPDAPDRTVMLKKYAMRGLAGLLWIVFFIILIKLIGTFGKAGKANA